VSCSEPKLMPGGAAAKLFIRALDIALALLLLATLLPTWPFMWWAVSRREAGFRAEVDTRSVRAWYWSLFTPSSLLRSLGKSPLLLAVLSGHWSMVGAGAWLSGEQNETPLKPGLISIGSVRSATGIARATPATLDAELATRWGPRAYLGLLARGFLVSFLPQSLPARFAQAEVCGIPLANASLRQLVETITVAARGPRSLWGCFLNADCVTIAQRDQDYAACLRRCDVVLPDGIGVRLAVRASGGELGENLVGTDLLPALCESSRESGVRIFLLGGKPGVAERAAARMRREHPGCRIVGTRDGFFKRESPEELEVLAEIRRSGAEVLLVGFGAPLQERWIERKRSELAPQVLLGVGGLLDYYAGVVPRAPIWIRELGLEWLFRLSQEPKRLWRRYLLGGWVFVGALLARRFRPLAVAP
jgi:N-acetylglucosaminyldiphosphoundecaprenol N-acetyl-beta-D-mannosaminyltransferase